MKKFIISSLFLVGMAVGASSAFAQTDSSQMQGMQERFRQERDALQQRAKSASEQFKQERDALQEKSRASGEQFKMQSETLREQMKTTREDFKTKIEESRRAFQEKRKTEKDELKARLKNIKDERKKSMVENLDKRFDEINQKTTAKWVRTLTLLDELLAKITLRQDKAAANGKDVAASRAASIAANTAIGAARAAVVAQTAKTYPIPVTTDTTLKSVVAQTRNALNTDLKAVRDLVQVAHKAVSATAQALRGIPGVNETATTTPATTTPATQ